MQFYASWMYSLATKLHNIKSQELIFKTSTHNVHIWVLSWLLWQHGLQKH